MRVSLFLRRACAVAAGLLVLTGCSGLSELPTANLSAMTTSSVGNSSDPIVEGTPIQLYTHLASHIKQCWLKKPEPLLKQHVFFAKAAPDQSGGQASISLNEETPDGKRGLTSFKIDLIPADGGKTNVQIHNFRLAADVEKRLTSDVRYWSHGKGTCKPETATASVGGNGADKIVSVPSGVKITQTPPKTQP